MKILYIASHLSTGGMPAFLAKKIEILKDDVEIFVVEYECLSLDFVVQRNQIIEMVGENFKTLGEDKFELIEVINEWKPDIVHLHEPSERLDRDVINLLFYPNRTYKIVETCHDVSFQPNIEKIYHPDAYAFCTPYHLQTWRDTPSYKSVIEFPIEYNKVTKPHQLIAKESLNLDTDKFHVLNVGLWCKWKNQAEVIEVARLLPNVEFHFVGNQAENFKEYWQPLMKRLPRNCTVWGERSDVSAFLKACDVFLFTSTWECNPLVLKEALGYGKSILARNLSQYGEMFQDRIVPIVDGNIPFQIAMLLVQPIEYAISKVEVKNFRKQYLKLYNHTINIKTKSVPATVTCNFVSNPFVEVKGDPYKTYNVKFFDGDKLVYTNTKKGGFWSKLNREYYTKWRIEVTENNKVIFNKTLDYKNQGVYIAFESSSIGDTIAWIPYCLEFQIKHDCHVIVSTFHNDLFENVYQSLEFVDPGVQVDNLMGMYRLGWFYNDNKEPVLPNTIPLQQAATNILGLEYKEIRPRINRVVPIETDGRLVTIATNSTAGCKFWPRENWQEVINYLHDKGYRVVNTSLEDNPFDNCEVLEDKSLSAAQIEIDRSELFIGLSSGLSWLAWALEVPVVMIANFTEAFHEFECIRPVNTSVCHGCWNNPEVTFDKNNWNWCPFLEGTDRQFECQNSITPKQVIEAMEKGLTITSLKTS